MQRLLHSADDRGRRGERPRGLVLRETLLNLRRLGFPAPSGASTGAREQAHGFPCFPTLSELPGRPTPWWSRSLAAGVAAVVEEAGELGCGGAVVYGAGFGESAKGAGLERDLAAAALRHGLPVCGPNGNGIVQLHERVALSDALRPLEPGGSRSCRRAATSR